MINEFAYQRTGLNRRLRKGPDDRFIPSAVQIELTSYCNAVCFFCAHTGSERPQQHMAYDLYRKIIRDVHDLPLPLSILYLTGLGEPMMHPVWRELFWGTKGLPAAFTTNCSLIKPEDIDFLLDLDFYEIAFSLDTLNPARHWAIRGFEVDRVAPKIESILARAKERGTKTRLIISTTLTYETLQDMRPMYEFLAPLLAEVPTAKWHIKQIGAFPDVKAPVQIMPPMNFIKEVHKVLPENQQVAVIDYQDAIRPYCTLWYDRVTILSNGTAVPCCHQAKARQDLGNIRDKSLVDIFNSQEWIETRRKFSNREGAGGWDEIPYCKDCR